ncbi:recombinase family protein [Actinoplanes auranticolor]|uniref:recombinase family protein n=1 Tax=Actinoplanes auranticolor TaxID=47988 RepID=UPI001BB45D07|nr:recombinase family protein [Actinoplanes auranticolor]
MATKRHAAIYLRISDDREGRELGVNRQREDCIALAKRLGIAVFRIYEDNDISASTRSRKERPQYKQLISDARAGMFSTVIAYTSGRLTRRVREHEDLIELAEEFRTEFVYVRSPSLNLNDAAGRTVARILAATDAGEAENISERVVRDVKRRAEAKMFHGGAVPFGHRAIKELINGRERVVGIEIDPERRAWLEEAAERVLSNESVYGICVDWNAKGRLSSAGKRWSPRTLKRALTSEAAIGKRKYEGMLHDAPWEPILDEATWEVLCDILNDPERKKSTSNQRKYPLSGLVFCPCGNRLTSTSDKAKQASSFECSSVKTSKAGCGKIRIVMAPLERYIVQQVFTRLDSPQMRRAVATEQDGAHTAERDLRKAVRDDERALERLEDEYDDGGLAEDRYKRRKGRITRRLEDTRAALLAVTEKATRANLPTGAELRAVWDTKDNTWKRTMLGSIIERIQVGPQPINPKTGRLFPSAPPRRRNEDEDAWRQRFDLERAKQFALRVSVTWRH